MAELIDLETDPERLSLRRAEWRRRFNTVQVPVVRLAGVALVTLAVAIHWLFVNGSIDMGRLVTIAAVLIGYAVVSWRILAVWFDRAPVLLPNIFFICDVAVCCIGIYETGGDASLIFFSLLFPMVSESHTGFRRMLVKIHVPIAAYLALMVYLSVGGRVIDWPVELFKAAGLYLMLGFGLTISLNGERNRHSTKQAIDRARRELEERRAADQRLNVAEERYRILVEDLPNAFFYAYRVGEGGEDASLFLSPQSETLFGFSPEDAAENPKGWLRMIHEDDRDRVVGAIRGLTPEHCLIDLEYRSIARDGDVLWVRNKGRMIFDEEGRRLEARGFVHDINELKNIEQRLITANSMSAEAREAAEERAEQLATINRVASALSDVSELDSALASAAREVTSLFDARGCTVFLQSPDGDSLELAGEYFAKDDIPSAKTMRIPLKGNPAWAQLLETGVGIIVPDARNDELMAGLHDSIRERGIVALMIVPLFARDELQGIVSISTDDSKRTFTRDDLFLAETLASQVSRAIENARLLKSAQLEIEERRWTEERLRQAEDRYRKLVEGVPLVIYTLTITGPGKENRRFYMSPQAEKVWGLPANEFAEDPDRWLQYVHDDDRDRVVEEIRRQQKLGPVIDLEYRFETAHGVVWVRNLGTTRFDEEGRPIEVIGVAIEISELKRVQEELSLANEELVRLAEEMEAARDAAESATHAKSDFLAKMSHEIRTPLNAILGYVQLMLRNPAVGAPERENLSVIHRSGEHLLTLISDVLSMSKIEAGNISLDEQSFDLRVMLENLRRMFAFRASARSIVLDFVIDDSVPTVVTGDEPKLRQILINLLGNAFKFTSRGTIAVAVRWSGGVAEFEVSDTGCGIDVDELGMLFDPFVQTASGRRQRSGTGLGLAISRHYVGLMGGSIRATSEPGKGSTFHFSIRLPPSEGFPLPASERRVLRVKPAGRPRRVLVVDDTKENRDVLVQLLRSVGFATLDAADGEEAVALWTEFRPDFVWMDMQMPAIDGYEATREIRRRELDAGHGRTPIMALTAGVFDKDRDAVLEAGCDGFVTKPFRDDELFEILGRSLDIEYEYENDVPPKEENVLAIERVGAIPPETRRALLRAVVEGDVTRGIELAEEIAENDEGLGDCLKEMVRTYRFDELQNAIGTRSEDLGREPDDEDVLVPGET